VLEFSIVIPSYDRPERLKRLLSAIAGQRFPRERFEVIVVDDGSPVPLDALVAEFRGQLRVSLLRQANAGPAAARNRGAGAAGGAALAFTDDDCEPDAGWLAGMAQALQRSPGAVCGGKTVNGVSGNLAAEATQLLADYLYAHYNPAVIDGAFYATNNMAVPAAGFRELGGFDGSLRFGEDREFCYRWAASGRPFVSAPEAVVRHMHPLTPVRFLRLHFLYGSGTGRFRLACRRKGLRVPGYSPVSWYLGLLTAGLRREPNWRGLALCLLLAASQAATVAGMLYAWAGGQPRGGRREHETS